MQKTQFKIEKKSWLKSFYNFLINLFIGVIISSITFLITFHILEKYFADQYTNSKSTPKTAMNLQIYQESPNRSWDHKPFAEAEHGFGYPTPKIKINSIGLRNEEIPQEKTNQRFLMLGDSFTFGMGVDQDKTFSVRVQEGFGTKKQNIINAGVIGQTIDDAFMYLKYQGMSLKPDFVIYNFFVGNDVTELKRHKWKEDEAGNIVNVQDNELYVDKENRLRLKGKSSPKSFFLFWLKQKLEIIKQKYSPSEEIFDPTLTWPIFLSENHELQDEHLEEYWIKFEEILKQINAFCEKKNIKFFIGVIPMDVQVSKQYWKKYPNLPFDDEAFKMQRPQKRIKELGEKYGIKIFDALPILKHEESINGSFYFDEDPHFNVLGHRFYGAYLWRFIVNEFFKKY